MWFSESVAYGTNTFVPFVAAVSDLGTARTLTTDIVVVIVSALAADCANAIVPNMMSVSFLATSFAYATVPIVRKNRAKYTHCYLLNQKIRSEYLVILQLI